MPITNVVTRVAPNHLNASDTPHEEHHVTHSEYDQDIGVGTHERIKAIGEELGIDINPERTLTERLFNFVDGTALGLKLQEKTYSPTDEYVTRSPVRSAVVDHLRSDGHKVSFVEYCGLMELAGGFMMTIPILATPYGGVGAGFGVTANTLMRYRTSAPIVDGVREDQCFPHDTQRALQMTPGSEFEFTAQGRINVSGAVGATGGFGIPGATAGVGLLLGGGTSVKGEFNVNIMALDQPGKVRVTLRQLDEKTAGFLLRIRAGLNFAMGSITGPTAGGMLRAVTEKMGAANFEELVNTYTTLNASIFSQRFSNKLLVGSWDLDLHEPQAQQAYEALVRLNAAPAQELAQIPDSGVREVRAREHEVAYLFGADVGFLGQKLLIHEMLHTNRDGSMEKECGERIAYRNSIWSKVKKNIFTGTKQIDWEAVSVQRENGDHEPYLHLRFTQKDWDFGGNRLRRLLRFAHALEIPYEEMTGDDQAKLDDVSRRLSNRAEVAILTDIYFTRQGVANIDHATADEAKAAYLHVSSKIKKKSAGFDFNPNDIRTAKALQFIARYRELTGFKNALKIMDRLREVPLMREQYLALTGHNLHDDAKLLAHAEEFAKAVAELRNINGPEQVAEFFHRVGRLRGFDYMQSVAALAILAKHDETLINELSVSSGNMRVENVSEGKIEHPRDTIATHLHRVAFAT